MNFLAHAYLSFNNPELLVGNMISDFVKGSLKFTYSKEIQKGIMLHRQIDHFTDNHHATHKAKEVFRAAYRLYSGPIMDIIYDHYLAKDEIIFPENHLETFTQQVYQQLEWHREELPPVFLRVFDYMKRDDWLYHYKDKTGIANGLKGLVRRASFIDDSETAIKLFHEHDHFLNECYNEFFPDVKEFAKQEIEALNK